MLASHLLVAGPVEVVFTVGVFAFLAQHQPRALHGRRGEPGSRARWLWGLVLALLAAVPLGLIATGTAWGEWGSGELRDRLGYVPSGFERFGEWWTGLLPGYALPGGGEGAWAVVVYVCVGSARRRRARWRWPGCWCTCYRRRAAGGSSGRP